MVGVNIGVAAPMAYFPFGGAKDSFFGDLKAHGAIRGSSTRTRR
jgi:malonate-semialdehyde dehydrogenase (acetylating)/methylmalonate-semialdehyde dehydrogenase